MVGHFATALGIVSQSFRTAFSGQNFRFFAARFRALSPRTAFSQTDSRAIRQIIAPGSTCASEAEAWTSGNHKAVLSQ
eukprot:6245513-Prymnesium_polylepis.1